VKSRLFENYLLREEIKQAKSSQKNVKTQLLGMRRDQTWPKLLAAGKNFLIS